MRSTIVKPASLLQTLVLEIDRTSDIATALDRVIRTICQHCYWPYGEVWQLDPETDRLTKRAAFYQDETTLTANGGSAYLRRFAQISNSISFGIGAGIPGRIWASQQWEWHTNVSNVSDRIFLRHQAAGAFGIKTAFGIPLIDDNNQTIAVLALFHYHALTRNLNQVETIQTIASPIGQMLSQHRPERRSSNSGSRFQAFVEHSPDLIFIKDSQGHFTYANPRLESSFDLEHHEILGKTDRYFMPDEVAAEVRQNDKRVLATQVEQSLIEVVPTADGIERHWQVSKFPFTDKGGQPLVGGIAHDITQLCDNS